VTTATMATMHPRMSKATKKRMEMVAIDDVVKDVVEEADVEATQSEEPTTNGGEITGAVVITISSTTVLHPDGSQYCRKTLIKRLERIACFILVTKSPCNTRILLQATISCEPTGNINVILNSTSIFTVGYTREITLSLLRESMTSNFVTFTLTGVRLYLPFKIHSTDFPNTDVSGMINGDETTVILIYCIAVNWAKNKLDVLR
jgi:hypothetical protein